MKKISTILLLLLAALSPSHAQSGFRIAELNTENFFDCQDDPFKDDDQFLPSSLKKWHLRRYWNKLQNISKEITSLGTHQLPDIIALTEVENDSVLTHLTKVSILRRAHYQYVMTNSQDNRGIDVALLYQPSTFKLLESQSIHVDFTNVIPINTRDILHVKGHTYTGDTLHIFVCHFSSKLGGRKYSEEYRKAEARSLKQKVQEIQSITRHANIIILGDFNETPHEEAIATVLNAKEIHDVNNIASDSLYNLSANYTPKHGIDGTYKYKEQWEMIDQIIISGNLLNPSHKLYTTVTSFNIHTPKFILQKDDKYQGYKPFKTYEGYKYQGGFSDHLPIYVDFITK